MILRRISESIRRQDWFVLLLEVVIVVAGVFIGIEVANWNETRQERQDEAQYLQRIHTDLLLSQRRIESATEWIDGNAKTATFMLERLQNCELAPEHRDRFAQGLYVLGKFNAPQLMDSTLEEMKSSGQLRLLRNQNLRTNLMDLQSWFAGNRRQFAQLNGWAEPHVEEIHARTVFIITEPIGGGGPIAWSEVEFDFPHACQDRRFHAAISSLRNYSYDNVAGNQSVIVRLDELVAEVEAELNRIDPDRASAP